MKAATRLRPVRKAKYLAFQSTPPVKAATPILDWADEDVWISIHAAREGGDIYDRYYD